MSKISRINPSGKLAPVSTAKVDGQVSKNSPNFNRAGIFFDNPVKSPNDMGQKKTDWEETEYKGNADSKDANGRKLKENK
jgi:hypothetical protein